MSNQFTSKETSNLNKNVWKYILIDYNTQKIAVQCFKIYLRTGFGHESKNSKKSKCHLAPKIVNIKIEKSVPFQSIKNSNMKIVQSSSWHLLCETFNFEDQK
jgi:hypothetical protein